MTKDSTKGFAVTKDSTAMLGCADATMKMPAERKLTNKEQRFVEYLLANEEPCQVAAQLQREGAHLPRVFRELTVYIEGRSIADERWKHGKEHGKIINMAVRKYGVAPEVGRWLQDRSELAHSTDGFIRRVRNMDSLAADHYYLEAKTGRKVTMRELAHLLDAAYWALGRTKIVADPVQLGQDLRRYAKKNVKFLKILKDNVLANLDKP